MCEDNIIKKLENIPQYKNLFNKNNIIFVVRGGSFLANALTDNSDYDITCYLETLDGIFQDGWKQFHFEIEGKLVHHTILDLASFLLQEVGLQEYYAKHFGLSDEALIYLNPSYKNLWELLKRNKDKLAILGLYNSMILRERNFKQYPKDICFNKHMYAELSSAKYFDIIDITQEEILYYKIHCENLSSSEKAKYFDYFNAISAYFKANPINVEKIQNELLNNFKRRCNERRN